jgi:hypothetical protein
MPEETATEIVLRLANAAFASPLEIALSMAAASADSDSASDNDSDSAADSDSDSDPTDDGCGLALPHSDDDVQAAEESQDNDNMQNAGVSMGPNGKANYGSVVLGQVVPHPSGRGFVGVHNPTTLRTKKKNTRAKAALALLDIHHVMPKKGDKAHAAKLSNSNALELIINLAGDAPGNGAKPYGDVKYADPKNGKYPIDTAEHAKAAWAYINKPANAEVYPLNGVTLAEVKSAIESSCKKFGIDTSK